MCSTMRGDPVSDLIGALERLAGEELTGLFGPVLLERLRRLLPAANRLAAELARTVRQAEAAGAAEFDGLASMAS
jgi:hypothetical protein